MAWEVENSLDWGTPSSVNGDWSVLPDRDEAALELNVSFAGNSQRHLHGIHHITEPGSTNRGFRQAAIGCEAERWSGSWKMVKPSPVCVVRPGLALHLVVYQKQI